MNQAFGGMVNIRMSSLDVRSKRHVELVQIANHLADTAWFCASQIQLRIHKKLCVCFKKGEL